METSLRAIVPSSVPRATKEDGWSIAAGVGAFWSTIALSTVTQQRLLGITTATQPPLPTLVGLATVGIASLASHHAALIAHEYAHTGKLPRFWERNNDNAVFGSREDYLSWQQVQIPLHAVRICCLGLLTFKLLGGRYWAVAPSSFTHLGSFARVPMSIPATQNYATSAERAAMERLGRIWGCHTCGSHMLFRGDRAFRFVGDHMPPKSVAENMNQRLWRRLTGWKVNYRFFPQCRDCSSVQGSILSKATNELQNARSFLFLPKRLKLGNAPSHTHGLRPRINHLTGAILGGVAVVGANEADLIDGNRHRYAQWQHQMDKWLRQQYRTMGKQIRKLGKMIE